MAGWARIAVGTACCHCGRPGAQVCSECVRNVLHMRPVNRAIGAPALPCWAGAPYGHTVASLVLTFKKTGNPELARVLGELLSRAASGWTDPILVPVPSSRSTVANVGGHPARVLCGVANSVRSSAGLQVCPVVDLLAVQEPRRGSWRPPVAQKSLSRRDRSVNATSRLTLRAHHDKESLSNRPVLIVDDVVTTGSTASAAARLLASAGWPVSGAVSAALVVG